MLRKRLKKIVSLVLCVLLLLSVIDLSSNGWSNAEEPLETATNTDANEEAEFDFSIFEDENGNFDENSFIAYLETLSDEDYQNFIDQYGDTIDFLLTNGFFGEDVDTPILMSNSGESIISVHSTGLDFDSFKNIQVSWFNISDGSAALCVTHAKNRPNAGQMVADDNSDEDPSVWDRNMSEELYRCFYFGWVKDKGTEIFSEYSNSKEMGYLAVSLIATEEFYGAGDSLNTGNSDLQGRMKEYANAHAGEIPNAASVTFSKTTLNTSVDSNKDIFETEYVKFGNNDSTSQSVSIILPENISAVVKRPNGTEIQCNPKTEIHVFEGEQIKFQAPLSVTGSFTVTANAREEILSHQARCYYFGDSYQRLLAKKVSKPSVNLNFEFQSLVSVAVKKESKKPSMTNNNPMYSVKGAQFGLYPTRASADNNTLCIATLTTDANGTAQVNNLSLPATGKFYIKELVAPKGYILDNNVYTINVTAANTKENPASITIKDAPIGDPMTIVVRKVVKHTDGTIDEGKKLPGAVFKVSHYASATVTGSPDATWYFVTDNNGEIKYSPDWLYTGAGYTSSAFMTDDNGDYAMSLGCITVQEVIAPANYKLDSSVSTYQLTTEHATLPLTQRLNEATVTNTPYSEPFMIIKSGKDDEGNTQLLADAGFNAIDVKYLSKDTNGNYIWDDDAWNSHPVKIAQDGSTVMYTDENGEATSARLEYGTYLVHECDVPKGYIAVNDFIVEIKEDSATVREELKYRLTDLRSEIKTKAKDGLTDTKVGVVGETTTTVDTVIFTNLVIGREYTVTAIPMRRSTKEPLKDADGNIISNTITFTPTVTSGTVDISVTYDSSLLAGETVTMFEKVEYNGDVVCVHEEIEDYDQSVFYPSIGTQARDSITNDTIGTVGTSVPLYDTVALKNTVVGVEYNLTGVLMDKATKEPILQDGKKITSTITYVPTKVNDTVELKFDNVNTELLKGKSVVFFEYVYVNGVEVCSEADIDNVDQTIDFPEVFTTALDKKTDDHYGSGVDEEITEVDAVDCRNLQIGKKYVVNGILMDASTGKPILNDGKEITASLEFTATQKNMTVYLEYTCSSKVLQGVTTVCFEDLYHNDKLVYSHSDLSDKNQQVNYPACKSTATSGLNGTHYGTATKDFPLNDLVEYTNLKPNAEYVCKGYLVDVKTGEKLLIDGKPVLSEQKFKTSDKKNGSVNVVFVFDATSFEGKNVDVVCFEQIYEVMADGTLNEVTNHMDINDLNQQVKFPSQPKTGDDLPLGIVKTIFLLALCGVIVMGIVLIMDMKRRNR